MSTVLHLADAWPYGTSTDPGVVLFETCLRTWRMDLPGSATVVELGCHESDFAVLLKQARPDVTVIGIDARPAALDGPSFKGDRLIVGDAADRLAWLDAGSHGEIDAVIALSSVEHFGLGWYGDRVGLRFGGLTADVAALWEAKRAMHNRRCRRRLCRSAAQAEHPTGHRGWLYYDVPWSPDRYVQTAHYRRYTDQTLPHAWVQYDTPYVEHARTWVVPGQESALLPGRPTEDCETQPFYYVAVWVGV